MKPEVRSSLRLWDPESRIHSEETANKQGGRRCSHVLPSFHYDSASGGVTRQGCDENQLAGISVSRLLWYFLF